MKQPLKLIFCDSQLAKYLIFLSKNFQPGSQKKREISAKKIPLICFNRITKIRNLSISQAKYIRDESFFSIKIFKKKIRK